MIEETADNVPCPECGQPFGDHTLRDYRAHTLIDLKFEEIPDVSFDPLGAETTIVDHVDVIAGVLQVTTHAGDILILPSVEFRFRSSAGLIVPPIVFTADDPGMFPRLRRLLAAACDAAPMRAKQVAREATRAAEADQRREAS